MQATQKPGFRRLELVVVVSVLLLLTGIVGPRVGDHLAGARDGARLAHMQRIAAAIEQFRHDRGVYPRADGGARDGDWDVSHDGSFLTQLREGGYLDEELVDPVNDAEHHYRYAAWAQGDPGCRDQGAFFVLGLSAFENDDFARRHKGFFRCGSRNWGREMAFVTGGSGSGR